MISHSIARILLAVTIFLGGSAGASMLLGHASRPDGAATASLPDEDVTGLFERASFARMDKVIMAVCRGC
jgi:hypothetical protein